MDCFVLHVVLRSLFSYVSVMYVCATLYSYVVRRLLVRYVYVSLVLDVCMCLCSSLFFTSVSLCAPLVHL